MKLKKFILSLLATPLFFIGFQGQGEAKHISKPVSQRVLVNGKVVMDTYYSKNIQKVVRKNWGQTITILPKSSFAGIWDEHKPYKFVHGKMMSVFVNGKAIVDSKVPWKIYGAINKHIGQRIVVKQRDKEYEEFSPTRMNVVLKGPYSKSVLEDYLKVIVAKTNCLSTKPQANKVIKQWTQNGVRYNQHKNGGILSFSCKKMSGSRVQVVYEMLKKEYVLNMDWILIHFGKEYFGDGNLKRGNGYFSGTQKCGKDTYEEIITGVHSFSVK